MDRPPSKPWRVYGANECEAAHALYEDYTSQTAAYEAVAELTGFGHTARVWHWESGSWKLFERIGPVTTDPDTAG